MLSMNRTLPIVSVSRLVSTPSPRPPRPRHVDDARTRRAPRALARSSTTPTRPRRDGTRRTRFERWYFLIDRTRRRDENRRRLAVHRARAPRVRRRRRQRERDAGSGGVRDVGREVRRSRGVRDLEWDGPAAAWPAAAEETLSARSVIELRAERVTTSESLRR